jgi:hypothetical protein
MAVRNAGANEEGKLATPDITPAQLVAIAGAILGVLVAGGLDISEDLQEQIIDLITVLAPLLVVGDAAIRHGRSRAFAVPPRPIEEDDTAGA